MYSYCFWLSTLLEQVLYVPTRLSGYGINLCLSVMLMVMSLELLRYLEIVQQCSQQYMVLLIMVLAFLLERNAQVYSEQSSEYVFSSPVVVHSTTVAWTPYYGGSGKSLLSLENVLCIFIYCFIFLLFTLQVMAHLY